MSDTQKVMEDIVVTSNLKITNIVRYPNDPASVDLHAKVIYNGVQIDYTLFSKKDGLPWRGRFRGRQWTGRDGNSHFTQDNQLVDPATGKVSYQYTQFVEDIVTSNIVANFEATFQQDKDRISAAMSFQAAAVAESKVEDQPIQEEQDAGVSEMSPAQRLS